MDYPNTLDPYIYALNNPIILTDLSGLLPFPPQPDHRDLTFWIYREMKTNANGPDAKSIRELIDLANRVEDKARIGSLGEFAVGSLISKLLWGIGSYEWIQLVKDGARWDFKDQIDEEMGETIMLCHTEGCGWYDYSMPGNIHYGYVGRASGFSSMELHLGASYAEISDPAHKELIKTLGRWFINFHFPLDVCQLEQFNVNIYINFKWWKTIFDDPTDFAGVELGSELFDRVKYNLSLHDFQSLLQIYSPQLKQMPAPTQGYFNPNWPYPLRYFDGGG